MAWSPFKKLAHIDLYYRAYRYRWKVESPEIGFLLETVKPGFCAVDIGAHKGAYTYWMQRLVGGHGRVIAFEPQPILAQRLQRAVHDLGFEQVKVEAQGLGSKVGRLTLVVPGGDTPSPGASFVPGLREGKGLEIPVTTIDEYFAGIRVDFIKCDVEGYELDVFQGGELTLRRDRPVLLFECELRHQRAHAIQDVFKHLESLGYAGRFFWDGKLRDLSEFNSDKHQNPSRDPYANNFVFRSR